MPHHALQLPQSFSQTQHHCLTPHMRLLVTPSHLYNLCAASFPLLIGSAPPLPQSGELHAYVSYHKFCRPLAAYHYSHQVSSTQQPSSTHRPSSPRTPQSHRTHLHNLCVASFPGKAKRCPSARQLAPPRCVFLNRVSFIDVSTHCADACLVDSAPPRRMSQHEHRCYLIMGGLHCQ